MLNSLITEPGQRWDPVQSWDDDHTVWERAITLFRTERGHLRLSLPKSCQRSRQARPEKKGLSPKKGLGPKSKELDPKTRSSTRKKGDSTREMGG